MAKIISLFKYQGTIDDVTVYQSKGKVLAKKKSAISSYRIASDPRFVRVRENNQEFSTIARGCKMLKKPFLPIESIFNKSSLGPRLFSILTQVKNLDKSSLRGQRNLTIGFSSQAAKAELLGFDFNEYAPLSTILKKTYIVDPLIGAISIIDLVPAKDIVFGAGANMVGFIAVWASINFESGTYQSEISNEALVSLNDTASNINLTFPAPPQASGLGVMILALRFYQNLHGTRYLLSNKTNHTGAVVHMHDL